MEQNPDFFGNLVQERQKLPSCAAKSRIPPYKTKDFLRSLAKPKSDEAILGSFLFPF